MGLAVESGAASNAAENHTHAWWYAALAGCLLLMVPLSFGAGRDGHRLAGAGRLMLLLTGGRPSLDRAQQACDCAGARIWPCWRSSGCTRRPGLDGGERGRGTAPHHPCRRAVATGKTGRPLGSSAIVRPRVRTSAPSRGWPITSTHAHNVNTPNGGWKPAGWGCWMRWHFALVRAGHLPSGASARLRSRGGDAILAVSCCGPSAQCWRIPGGLSLHHRPDDHDGDAGRVDGALADALVREKSRRRIRHERGCRCRATPYCRKPRQQNGLARGHGGDADTTQPA